MDQSNNPELLSVKDAAILLKVSTRSVRRLLEKKVVSSYKILGSVRIEKKDITEYLSRVRTEIAD